MYPTPCISFSPNWRPDRYFSYHIFIFPKGYIQCTAIKVTTKAPQNVESRQNVRVHEEEKSLAVGNKLPAETTAGFRRYLVRKARVFTRTNLRKRHASHVLQTQSRAGGLNSSLVGSASGKASQIAGKAPSHMPRERARFHRSPSETAITRLSQPIKERREREMGVPLPC